jgi:DNA-binding transcriptional ArsR family regulator
MMECDTMNVKTNSRLRPGWTPVSEILIEEFGLITAAVFGRVRRFCQMRNGQCTASLQTIGDSLGISPRTVANHLKLLVDAGYLTAERRHGRTTAYRDLGLLNDEDGSEGPSGGIPLPAEGKSELGTPQIRSPLESDSYDRELRKDKYIRNEEREEEENKSHLHNHISTIGQPEVYDAAAAYTEITLRTLSNSWKSRVLSTVGEDERDLERWKKTISDWLRRGYNPNSIYGILDVYQKGGRYRDGSKVEDGVYCSNCKLPMSQRNDDCHIHRARLYLGNYFPLEEYGQADMIERS